MWDLPGPGLEPLSPALAGGFLTTAPPGKSLHARFLTPLSLSFFIYRNGALLSPTRLQRGLNKAYINGPIAEQVFKKVLRAYFFFFHFFLAQGGRITDPQGGKYLQNYSSLDNITNYFFD